MIHVLRAHAMLLTAFALSNTFAFGRTMILEMKGTYFLPINDTLRKAYGNGSALYGPELSIQLGKKDPIAKNMYGYMSMDYFQKKGKKLGLCDSATLRLIPLTMGLKYSAHISPRVDGYAGLGFESLYIQKDSHRGCVKEKKIKWAFGGISKMGTYIKLPRRMTLNLFFDYSFIKTMMKGFYGPTASSCKVNLSSALFGLGLGYRF